MPLRLVLAVWGIAATHVLATRRSPSTLPRCSAWLSPRTAQPRRHTRHLTQRTTTPSTTFAAGPVARTSTVLSAVGLFGDRDKNDADDADDDDDDDVDDYDDDDDADADDDDDADDPASDGGDPGDRGGAVDEQFASSFFAELRRREAISPDAVEAGAVDQREEVQTADETAADGKLRIVLDEYDDDADDDDDDDARPSEPRDGERLSLRGDDAIVRDLAARQNGTTLDDTDEEIYEMLAQKGGMAKVSLEVWFARAPPRRHTASSLVL